MTRVNTYTSAPRVWPSECTLIALRAHIVAFASPSAVNTWFENTKQADRAPHHLSDYKNKEKNKNNSQLHVLPVAVCIGSTTAAAAKQANAAAQALLGRGLFRNITCPEKPSIDSWAEEMANVIFSIDSGAHQSETR